MLGFELNIKNQKISASVERGVVSVIATQLNKAGVNSIELDLAGLDTGSKDYDKHLKWYNTVLEEGDEFTVKVKNIETNSTVLETRKGDSRELSNQSKLKAYYELKQELEDLKLI